MTTFKTTKGVAEQERVQELEDSDHASFAMFIGRGELSDQS